MRLRVITLCFVSLFACFAEARRTFAQSLTAQPLAHRRWSEWSHLRGLSVDDKGFVSLADNRRIYRFDGTRFNRVLDLPNDAIAYTAHRDTTWILYRNGSLSQHRDIGTLAQSVAPKRASRVGNTRLWIDLQGRPLYLSSRGLMRASHGAIERVRLPPLVQQQAIHDITFASGDRMLVATDAGLWLVRPEGDLNLFDQPTTSVAVDAATETYFFTTRDGALWKLPAPSQRPEVVFREPGGAVYAFTVISGRVLWLVPARSDEEVMRLDLTTHKVLGSARIPLSAVAAKADQDGALWLAHAGGLVTQLYEPLGFTLPLLKDARLPAFAALQTPQGDLWYTTVQSVVHQPAGGEPTVLANVHPPLRCARSLALLANDELAISTCNHGVAWRQGGGFSFFDTSQGLANDRTRVVWPALHGGIWVGFTYGGAQHVDRGKVQPPIPEFRGVVAAFAESDAEGLWMATDEGVFNWNRGRLRAYGETEGLKDPRVRSLALTPQGTLLAGTSDEGLFFKQEDRWHRVGDEASPFPSRSVFGILREGQHYWFSSSEGVFVVNADLFESHLRGQAPLPSALKLGTNDGMRSPRGADGHMPTLTPRQGGGVWVPTAMGVSALRVPTQPQHGNVAITRLVVDGSALPIDQKRHVVAANARALQVSLARSAMSQPQHTWIEVLWDGKPLQTLPHNETLLITDIPSRRNARLNVRLRSALSPEVVLSDVAIALQRRSAMSQPEVWMLLVLALALGALAWTVFASWRVRRRFALVLEERNRIARDLHDSLAQGFTALGYHLKRVARSLQGPQDKTNQLVRDFEKLLRGVRLEARHAVWNLRSEGMARRDLTRAIEELAEQSTLASGAEVTARTEGAAVTLPEGTQTDLVRIAQEAVTNAVGHGKATKVELTLSFARDAVCLTVVDNGVGLVTPPQEVGHFGMMGMAERAQRIGGSIGFENGRDQGFVVRVLVPLQMTSDRKQAGL